MCELLGVFRKLSEFYPTNLLWEDVESIFLAEQEKSAQQAKELPSKQSEPAKRRRRNESASSDSSGVEDDDGLPTETSQVDNIPIVMTALNDPSLLSALLEVSTTIRTLRESTQSYDNTFDCWDQVIKVSPRDGFLACIYTLVSLGNFDPKCRKFRQISMAASSAYFLSLTIPGAKGFHIFEEEVISVALQVFSLLEKIQKPDIANGMPQHESIEMWVNFTSFCDDIKMIFRFVHFEEYKSVRNAIVKKLIEMQYMTYEKGFCNSYAVNLYGKYFEILDEVVSAHNGDPKQTLLKILNMTIFLHAYAPKPKGSAGNAQTLDCEHISDWFIKMINKFPRLVSEVLELYIQCVVTNPERAWKTEQTQRALEYAAKYDAALFTRCNASIVDFLSEAIYADEVGIRSRSVDLFSKMILLESNVDWAMFRHEISEIPREVYIIKELIDSIRDANNNIKTKALQGIQQGFARGSPNTQKILLEGLKFAQFNDGSVKLPKEPKVLKNEIRFGKPASIEPAYTFNGSEIVILSFLYLPKNIYLLFSNPIMHLRRAAIILLETIVKINPLIIFSTEFVTETCSLVNEPTALVRKQTLIMVDSILATFPNCHPVIYVWCKIIAPMMQDSEPKNVDLAMECFRTRVLLNIKGIDQTNQAEHFMPWVIIRTLLMTHSRLYLQISFHKSLKIQMINQQIISTIESHILASNSTEAWILLNFICGKIKSKEPDSLIHCFVSYHSSLQWNNEQNLLIALEVLTACVKDFSFSALNNVFKHLLKSIKDGMILPQVIGKAFDFLSTVDHHSNENQLRSTSSTSVDQSADPPMQDWILDLHKYLEDKLLEEMPNFPENHSTYMSYMFSYSEANLEIKQHPHETIVHFIHNYMIACVDLPESELELDNDRIFNSMILIAARFSIRDDAVASNTIMIYGKILSTIDRPPIVNTILVALSDLCKKHTQIVETILDMILEKLSSKYLINRLETFRNFTSLVLQDQLKLRGSLLLALLAKIFDDNEKLSAQANAFFAEYLSKKNPALFHKCLIECPFVLNEYMNFEGLDTFTENMIKSPLKGNEKRKLRHKLYNHLMEDISDVNLLLYFGNLKLIAEKTQNDPHIKSSEGIALIKDILFIVKRICQRERREPDSQPENPNNDDELSETPNNTTAEEPLPSTSSAAAAAIATASSARKGRRRDAPTMADAMTTLEKSIVFITTIAENIGGQDEGVQRAIDDLAKALSTRFPQLVEFAQPPEFWSKYREGKVTSTPMKRSRPANASKTPNESETTSAPAEDEDEEDEAELSFINNEVDDEADDVPSTSKRQRKSIDTLEYLLLH